MQFVASLAGAVFEPLLSPGDIDENLLHRTGGGLEEMATIGELQTAVSSDLQSGLVDEGGGLQSLSRFFIGHPDGGQPAQFLVDQWQQLLGGGGVALLSRV